MGCLDTLRLSPNEQTQLLRYLEGSGVGAAAGQREHERINYRPVAGIVMSLEHPGGSNGLFLVRPRNLSGGGIGFLHGAYLHRGSRCGMALRMPGGGCHTIAGRIAWCRHVRGHVHEAGAAFAEPIEVHEFVNTCLRTDEPDPHGEPGPSTPMPAMTGRVLYVEDAEDERDLLKFQLGQLGVELHTADDVVAAIDRLEREAFDLILTGIWLPGLTGLDLIEQVRTHNAPTPVLALTADPTEALHREALARGAERVLVKPYTFQTLIDAMAPYLARNADHTAPTLPLVSQYASDPAMRPLIERYVDRLQDQVRQIETLLAKNPKEPALRKATLDIKGSAGNYGYPTLSEAAHRLYELTEQAGSAEELLAVCGDELTAAQAHLTRLAEAARAGLDRST